MATLARLMPAHQPLLIEPEKYALSGENLSGKLSIQDLSGLSDLVQNRDGTVKFEMAFSRDNKGWLKATGTISGSLVLQCQRCLEAMTHEVHNTIQVVIVNNQEEIENLPENFEPFLAEERKISLNKLIEEELSLALPLSPLHQQKDCPAGQTVKQQDSNRDSPFAVLKELKKL